MPNVYIPPRQYRVLSGDVEVEDQDQDIASRTLQLLHLLRQAASLTFPAAALWHEPESMFEAIFRYVPIDLFSDRAYFGSLSSSRSRPSLPRFASARSTSRPLPDFVPPSSSSRSPYPGPQGDETTHLGPRLAGHFARHHPHGVDFVIDIDMISRLQGTLEARLSTDLTSEEEASRLRKWVSRYHHAIQLHETAVLLYETEQNDALRITLAEMVNDVLSDERLLGRPLPDDGRVWTGPQLTHDIGVPDLVCGKTSGAAKALLECKRYKALARSDMDTISSAASGTRFRPSRLGSRIGFTLNVELNGEIVCQGNSVAENMDEAARRACLQIYAQLHSNKCSYDVLFNSRETLTFHLEKTDVLRVSTLIHKMDAAQQNSMNLAAIMLALALHGHTDDSSNGYLSLEVIPNSSIRPPPDSTRSTRGDGRGHEHVIGQAGETEGDRMDIEGGGYVGEDADNSSTKDFLRHADANRHTFPHPLGRLCPVRASSATSNCLGMSLTISKPISRGRLWSVYLGYMSPAGISKGQIKVSLDPKFWKGDRKGVRAHTERGSPTLASVAWGSLASPPTEHVHAPPRSLSQDGDDTGKSAMEFAASRASGMTRWTPASVRDKSRGERPIKVAVKILNPDGECDWESAKAAAVKEMMIYEGPLRDHQTTLVPRFYGLWETLGRYVMILEYLKPWRVHDWEDIHDSDRMTLARMYNVLHGTGVAHNDIEPRHVRSAVPHGLRLIDFEGSKRGDGFIQEEAKKLQRILGIDIGTRCS